MHPRCGATSTFGASAIFDVGASSNAGYPGTLGWLAPSGEVSGPQHRDERNFQLGHTAYVKRHIIHES